MTQALDAAANTVLMAWGSRDPESLTAPFAAALTLARAFNAGNEPPPPPPEPAPPVDVAALAAAARQQCLIEALRLIERRVHAYQQQRNGADNPFGREAKACANIIRTLMEEGT